MRSVQEKALQGQPLSSSDLLSIPIITPQTCLHMPFFASFAAHCVSSAMRFIQHAQIANASTRAAA
jgi:hypothetical protein